MTARIEKSTLDFLKQLKKNNNREWFEKNKENFIQANYNVKEFTGELILNCSKFDNTIADQVAAKCVFRIYRDVRFSKNKEPYKTNFGASINHNGRKSGFAGYYLHLQPGESFIGGGMYMPQTDILAKVRQEIDYSFKELTSILTNKKFKKYYHNGLWEEDKLKTVPKGYDKDNRAIEFLKNKHFVAMTPCTEDLILSNHFLKHCTDSFKALNPFLKFLNKAMV